MLISTGCSSVETTGREGTANQPQQQNLGKICGSWHTIAKNIFSILDDLQQRLEISKGKSNLDHITPW